MKIAGIPRVPRDNMVPFLEIGGIPRVPTDPDCPFFLFSRNSSDRSSDLVLESSGIPRAVHSLYDKYLRIPRDSKKVI